MGILNKNAFKLKKAKICEKIIQVMPKDRKRLETSATKDCSSDEEEYFCSRHGVQKSIKYYLQNTTLHGLKYLAEDQITTPERVLFGVAFIGVVITSAFFISNVYTKWSATPIIISTNARQSSINEVPFPAITICNLNQARKSKVQGMERHSANYTLLMSLCDQTGNVTMSYTGTWRYFKAVLLEVAQPCDEMLKYCRFGSNQVNCKALFSPILTDDGLCCIFNALDAQFVFKNYTEESRFSESSDNYYTPIDWTPEKGYDQKSLPKTFFPRISGGTGSRMGLTVILNASEDEYYCSKAKSIGFKVLVHNPAEMPKISNYGFLVTAGREARIPVEPVYQVAVPGIRSISKQVRRCLFSDEGDLVFYRSYSQKNCELECEAKFLMNYCGCVLFHLPRIDPNVRICGPNDNTCTNRVQTNIEASGNNISCAYCWPACFELTYLTTVTSTAIVSRTFRSVDGYPDEIFNNRVKEISVVNFYFLSNNFRTTIKSEMFGFTEFLSNTGGLLGLFMGFSIFSIIEIVYYVTVRPYFSSRTMQKERTTKLDQLKWLTPIKTKLRRRRPNQFQRQKRPSIQHQSDHEFKGSVGRLENVWISSRPPIHMEDPPAYKFTK